MLTVCSLIFFSFIYSKSVKYHEEKHSRKFIHANRNWNLWFGKVDPRQKKLVFSIREIPSTRKKLLKLLLLFYQLYTFLLRMSSFILRKKRCFQPIWRRTYLEELLYCSRQNIQYECFQTVKILYFSFLKSLALRKENNNNF